MSFEKIIKIPCFLLILGLIGYCIYNKLSFKYVLILVALLILLPYASNITEFTFFNLLRVKIGRELERLLPDFAKAYKQLQKRDIISSLSNDTIKLSYLPDPTTIKITFGHETIIPHEDQGVFDIQGKEIKIIDEATIRHIEYYISQPPAFHPIVEYLRKVDNGT